MSVKQEVPLLVTEPHEVKNEIKAEIGKCDIKSEPFADLHVENFEVIQDKINTEEFESQKFSEDININFECEAILSAGSSNTTISKDEQVFLEEQMQDCVRRGQGEETNTKNKNAVENFSHENYEESLKLCESNAGKSGPYTENVENCSKHSKSSLIEHKRTDIIKKFPFQCDYCANSFSQKNHLDRHLRVHANEKPFNCNYCEKSFSQKSHLVEHTRFHTNDKPFKCGYCEKLFSRKGDHIKHTRRVHTNEKPFECNYCGKLFAGTSDHIRHTRIHTNEKPFKCNYCEKTFSQRGSLNAHIRIHTNEKPFVCDCCEKSFSRKCDLVRHTRIHTVKAVIV